MNYDWKYELESKVEEKIDYYSDDTGYEFLDSEKGFEVEWYNIKAIKKFKLTIDQRLNWLHRSIKTVEESARLGTIEWYKDNDEYDTDGMSDDEIEELDGFWISVESDTTMYWEDINEEYSDELKIIGSQRDERTLIGAITSAQDEMVDLIEKLEKEIIPESEKEVMMEIWDEE